jgi:hypothetical protein
MYGKFLRKFSRVIFVWKASDFSGKNITLVSFSRGVQTCLDAAKELEKIGVDAEVCCSQMFVWKKKKIF